MTAKTGTSGHAVYLRAQATATARAVRSSQPRQRKASARMVTAMTGGSVMPSTRGNAMTGEATAMAVIRATRSRQGRQVLTLCSEGMIANDAASSAIVTSEV